MDWGNPSLGDEEKMRRRCEWRENEEKVGKRIGWERERQQRHGGRVVGGRRLLVLGVDGRPQISAALSHSHVTGAGQWHRQYLNQLHCSSAIGGELRRQGSYWRQRPCGERASGGGEKGFLRIEKERRQRIGGRGAVVSQWKLVQTANLC